MEAKSTSVIDDEAALFREIVETLTAFDSCSERLLVENLAVLKREYEAVGDITALISSYGNLRELEPTYSYEEICRQLMEDEQMAHVIAQVLYLFYIGAVRINNYWRRCGWKQYSEALIWKTLGTHPPMTRGTGEYGDWAKHPEAGLLAGPPQEFQR